MQRAMKQVIKVMLVKKSDKSDNEDKSNNEDKSDKSDEQPESIPLSVELPKDGSNEYQYIDNELQREREEEEEHHRRMERIRVAQASPNLTTSEKKL